MGTKHNSISIALAGSHCTGKTTLFDQLKHDLSPEFDLKHITEVARKIIAKGYPLNQDANMESYIHYVNDQLTAEQAMFAYDVFVSDRTILDPLAYALVNKELPRPYVPDSLIEMMRNIWLMEKEKYDFYVYFPIEFPLTMDDVRPGDEDYRSRVDTMIYSLLMENDVDFITVNGSLEQRVETVRGEMKSRGFPF
ncbi:MAG: ATP-binding protein [Coriobacteriia bacterium]|nr:ATP-binding protein [Coriobacteriia bacterium]